MHMEQKDLHHRSSLEIAKGIIRLFVYIGGGLISFAIMLKLLDMLVKKQ